jgi:bifunctional non-homologous end joining protein LigD
MPSPRQLLQRYDAKRDFARTPEPSGRAEATLPDDLFVVQKHAARRLHYDFRLALDGVLKSWAVTRGPSLDPRAKRLAVHVEDHPMSYGDFEGIIPAGQYGGGTVMVWDRGTWEPVGDPHEGYRAGKLKFRLHGTKLQGGWTLVRMRPRQSERGDNWLLIKEQDEAAHPGAADEVTETETQSVATGRSLDEIARDRDRVHGSNRAAESAAAPGKTTAKEKPAAAKKPAARKQPTRKPVARQGRAASRPGDPLPAFVPPELATSVDHPPAGEGWLHEVKLDGYRTLCRLERGSVRMLTRTGLDWTERFAPLARAGTALAVETALVDGEIVVLDEQGVSSFAGLQAALKAGELDRLLYFAFDLLHLDGRDLRGEPLETRKALLRPLVEKLGAASGWRYSEHFDSDAALFYRQVCRLNLEGMVSKRRDAPYVPGRGRDWLKAKCRQQQEFVVGGYTEPTDAARGLASLLLGYYEDGKLIYAGRVGTGFTDRSGTELRRRLDAMRRDKPPFDRIARADARDARWVEPRLVAAVEFATWTSDKRVRQASFQGLREDKPAGEVRRELPEHVPDEATAGDPPKPARKGRAVAAKAKPQPAARAGGDSFAGIAITHPDRVVYEGQGVTKRDLAAYYQAIAGWILPHAGDRPLSLVRCPAGPGRSCFFQKHGREGFSERIREVMITEKSGTRPYMVVLDPTGLVSLVQMGVLEIHPWGSRADDIEHPDRIVMDLDPGEDVPWPRLAATAREVRERLSGLGLESFLKTTGGKGLHVTIPIDRRHDWDTVKGFAKGLADAMAADSPDAYVAVMSKARRRGRIFVDYLRNGRGATAIAPYSTRARPGATVATPLAWEELTDTLDPAAFTVATVPERLSARGFRDPWAEIGRVRQSLTLKARRGVGL